MGKEKKLKVSKKVDPGKTRKTKDKELTDKDLDRVAGGGATVAGQFDIQKRH